jgi:hypothetical protein
MNPATSPRSLHATDTYVLASRIARWLVVSGGVGQPAKNPSSAEGVSPSVESDSMMAPERIGGTTWLLLSLLLTDSSGGSVGDETGASASQIVSAPALRRTRRRSWSPPGSVSPGACQSPSAPRTTPGIPRPPSPCHSMRGGFRGVSRSVVRPIRAAWRTWLRQSGWRRRSWRRCAGCGDRRSSARW